MPAVNSDGTAIQSTLPSVDSLKKMLRTFTMPEYQGIIDALIRDAVAVGDDGYEACILADLETAKEQIVAEDIEAESTKNAAFQSTEIGARQAMDLLIQGGCTVPEAFDYLVDVLDRYSQELLDQ